MCQTVTAIYTGLPKSNGDAHTAAAEIESQHELARHVPARAARVRRQEAVFRSARLRALPAVPAYRRSPQTLVRRRTPSKFSGTRFRNTKPQLRMFPAVVGAPLLAIP